MELLLLIPLVIIIVLIIQDELWMRKFVKSRKSNYKYMR
jgi:hypothetical protein